ncbi:hypothetical protein ACFOKI_15035 [Sphingomonas qilianensis]|uniref:Tetratricopeptide repeat protein n=1 Tax=Sphingomonas qilianensis TaxID=1736690 RepID=A0ABU9XMB2_9SPHN
MSILYRHWPATAAAVALAMMPCAAAAETPRDVLTTAVFADRDKAVALAKIDRVHQVTGAMLARSGDDQEAAIVQATAIGYRAQLTGNRSGAVEARRRFEALVARYPNNPEAHLALGAWHIGVIAAVGQFVGRAAVGAQKKVGLASIDRALALGGNRAMYIGLAALLRLEIDGADVRGKQLAEAATRANAPTALDRIMQRSANLLLTPLMNGNSKATQTLADRLLPLGQIAKK